MFPVEPWTDPNTTRFQVTEYYYSIRDLYHVWDENMQAWFDMRDGEMVEQEQGYEKTWESSDRYENPFPSGDPYRAKKHILLKFLKEETKEELSLLQYTVKRYYEILDVIKKQFRGNNKLCILIWIMTLVHPQRIEEFFRYFEPGWDHMVRNAMVLDIQNHDLWRYVIKKWDRTIVLDQGLTRNQMMVHITSKKTKKELIHVFGKELYSDGILGAKGIKNH